MYQRQVYKQQLGNVAIYQSNEKRFFEEKDLFGMANLLFFSSSSVLTSDIIDKTQKKYQIVSNALAEQKKAPNVLEDILQAQFNPVSSDVISQVTGEEDEKHGIKGILHSHKATDMVGNNEEEKLISEKALSDLVNSKKTPVEKKREEVSPSVYDEQKRKYLERKKVYNNQFTNPFSNSNN